MSDEPNYINRKYILGGIAVAVVIIYLIRLFSLQLMSDDYKKNADSNAFRKEIQYPSRGLILDAALVVHDDHDVVRRLIVDKEPPFAIENQSA